MASGNIAKRWRVLSSEEGWEGLLDPLDPDLRRYLVHYGERVQGVNDSLINNLMSENFALSRYGHRNLFSKVGLVEGRTFKYDVKKYLYGSTAFLSAKDVAPGVELATGKSRWLGYVAVATDQGKKALGRRDILVAIRGALFSDGDISREQEIDKLFVLTSASDLLGDKFKPQVHYGWYSYYTASEAGSKYNSTSLKDQIRNTVQELVEQYKDEEVSITFTGHSMGGPLATLAATDIVYNGFNKPSASPNKAFPVTTFAFASPRLGDEGFAAAVSALDNLHVLRVRNKFDPVPYLPPDMELDMDGDIPLFVLKYAAVGQELVVDSTQSAYLNVLAKISKAHELELYLHAVAGFDPEVRDIALINKSLDALKDEYRDHGLVMWSIVKNKSMVQLENGYWVYNDHEDDDE